MLQSIEGGVVVFAAGVSLAVTLLFFGRLAGIHARHPAPAQMKAFKIKILGLLAFSMAAAGMGQPFQFERGTAASVPWNDGVGWRRFPYRVPVSSLLTLLHGEGGLVKPAKLLV